MKYKVIVRTSLRYDPDAATDREFKITMNNILKVLIEKLDIMLEQGNFSTEKETIGKKSNGNTRNQKQ